MRQYGTTPEHFAQVSVKNHRHSTKKSPVAVSGRRHPRGGHDAADGLRIQTRYICAARLATGRPLRLSARTKMVKKFGKKPIRVACSVLTSDPWTPRDLTLPDINTLTRTAAREAYERAGIGPDDLDLVELHDCFATAEVLHYANLGLCGEGEAADAIDQRWFEHGGRIPVNVSSGLLSKGHPLGATGVAKQSSRLSLIYVGQRAHAKSKVRGSAWLTSSDLVRLAPSMCCRDSRLVSRRGSVGKAVLWQLP